MSDQRGAALAPADIDRLFAQSSPFAAFETLEACFAALAEPERLERRRQVLAALEAQLPLDAARTNDLLKAVFAAAPAYLRAGQGGRSLNVGALVQTLFGAMNMAERVAFMRSQLPQLVDVSLACQLLQSSVNDPQAEAVFGADVGDLRYQLQPRVEQLAATGGLWQQALPAAVLWFWWSFAEESRVYEFVKASMGETKSLASLLEMVIEPAAEPGGLDLIAVRRWSKIIDFSGLERHALQLALNGAARDDRRRARRFLDAFGNGKSELFR